jgi:hypothetical protein
MSAYYGSELRGEFSAAMQLVLMMINGCLQEESIVNQRGDNAI